MKSLSGEIVSDYSFGVVFLAYCNMTDRRNKESTVERDIFALKVARDIGIDSALVAGAIERSATMFDSEDESGKNMVMSDEEAVFVKASMAKLRNVFDMEQAMALAVMRGNVRNEEVV